MAVHRLASIEAGQGGRPLLLLHGFTGAKIDFAEQLEPLAAAGFHAVAVDLPGHGDSQLEDAVYELDALADEVLAFAPWPTFALVGHSMGGVIAQHVAFRAADRLDALVLMDTSPDRFGVDLALVDVACHVVESEGMEALLAVQKQVGSPFESEAARRLRTERDGWVELQDRKLLQSAPAMYVAMARALTGEADRSGELGQLDVPTLVLVGEHDGLLLDASHRLAAIVPGAELVVIPGAGHSPQVEAPEAWLGAVTRFLSSPSRGTARRRPPPG